MFLKKRLIGSLIFVPLFLIASTLAQTAPPAGSWAQLPNTQLYPAMPSEAKPEGAVGGTSELWNPRGVFAFSGADVTQIDGVWGFLIWGGGHGDSPDNSLYWAPFDGSGAKRLTGPYLAPDKVYRYDAPLETYRSVSRNAPPTVTVAVAPKSRHTYSSLLRIDLHGRPAVFCYGGSLYVGSGSGTGATRIFDLSQTYAQAMARPDMGWALKAPAPSSAVSSSSGWDPVQKRVVTRSRGFIGAYYPETDRWENWNIQNAPFGSDFQASVAMDVVGRKMYVLGDRLAEVIDLDSKAYTDLRGKPWVAALPGVGGGTGYLAGPGISWHARTKQIVAWVGGNNLLLINPATDTIKSVTLGGAAVTAAPSGGTYGRFRVVPGTDQVVLVNAVDQDVFISIVPFDGGTPVPVTQAPPTPTPTAPQPSRTPPRGYLDVIDQAGHAAGWARDDDRPQTSIQVVLAVDGKDIATITANAPRPDVAPVNLGYVYRLPANYRDGQPHTLRVYALDNDGKTRVELNGSPMTFTLSGQPAQAPTPTPTPTPLPSPGTVSVPPGQPLPTRAWVERPMPKGAIQSYMQTGGKHGRAFYHPGLKSMVFAGGDWHTTQPQYENGNGVGSEIWALDVANDKWILQRPFCVPGETQPGGPDTVGWAYDRKRDRGLMTPGFYFASQGPASPCGALYGWGGYAFSFETKKFTGPDASAGLPPPPAGWGGDIGASYGLYNPTLDEYVRVRNGPTLERLSLSAKTWSVRNLSNGKPNWNPVPNRAQAVIDVKGQALYWLDAWSSPAALVNVNLKDGSAASIPVPSQYTKPSSGDQEVYLAFDPGNRVVLIPNNIDMGISPLKGVGIYQVETGRWDWEAVPAAVMGSVWGFDEAAGALIGIGKRSQPYAYFLYKYSAGSAAPAPQPQPTR